VRTVKGDFDAADRALDIRRYTRRHAEGCDGGGLEPVVFVCGHGRVHALDRTIEFGRDLSQ
jgi:hypothetical protein